MIVLCFNMRGRDTFELSNDMCHASTFWHARGRYSSLSVMHLHFSMQEEDILELTNGKCCQLVNHYGT